ncbi:hypothetical protein CBR_g10 [Chara braunii]|uniref:Uncharacterized protein n=1 Tax=Chara braunii TaxID=69332 RepID=A0A388JLC3_CHABU|nr:hypothetical protein CBR_g10 [Chara braunii]|eukprot:GBG58610.1 hypothetical protein CBR_g10 [Chara braunii]
MAALAQAAMPDPAPKLLGVAPPSWGLPAAAPTKVMKMAATIARYRVEPPGMASGKFATTGNGGILSAPTRGAAISNAIVPYQAPQNRGYAGGNGQSNGGYGNGGGFNSNYNGGQRYSRNWNGGYRERDNDDRFNKIYGLLAEQADEREQRKRETAQLASLEQEKKRLQEEAPKRVEEKKERELQEARLGQIVRSSMKVVCESALGRKVDLPGEEETEVGKLRRELEDLKSRCGTTASSSTSSLSLDTLRKEKEALLEAHNQSTEESRLRREIDELKMKINGPPADKGSDEGLALKLQVAELNGFRKALEEKNSELPALKAENQHLRAEFKDLRDEIVSIRQDGKRSSSGVVETSPPEAPLRGKPCAETQPQAQPQSQSQLLVGTSAMYTPKDLSALQKEYKDALAAKEMALREAEACKERMAQMGASKYRLSTRKMAVRRSTPRNLKTSMNAVHVDSDEDKEDEQPKASGEDQPVTDVARELEEAMMNRFRDKRQKELRTGKKADLEKCCQDEGISYIELDQAKMDVAEIRARQDYDDWLRTRKGNGEEEDNNQGYATSAEEI